MPNTMIKSTDTIRPGPSIMKSRCLPRIASSLSCYLHEVFLAPSEAMPPKKSIIESACSSSTASSSSTTRPPSRIRSLGLVCLAFSVSSRSRTHSAAKMRQMVWSSPSPETTLIYSTRPRIWQMRPSSSKTMQTAQIARANQVSTSHTS